MDRTIKALRAENQAARAALDDAIAAAQRNANTIQRERELAEKAIRDMAARYEERMARGREKEDAIREIEVAPPSDDGPIAPVLGRALDRLRQQQAAGGDAN